tara:strand:+ start:1132 stop:1398 length:267 start_codon:yes stop_codon:yes gene_type:complete
MNNVEDNYMIIETYADLVSVPSMNSNVTIYDDFLDSVDKSIITGDISFIENALKSYGNQLHPDSVKMASTIIVQILEEKMEEIILTSN